MKRGAKVHGVLAAPETTYARAKTAGWLLKSLEQKVTLESCFFECFRWVVGDLRRPLQAVMKEAQKPTGKLGIVAARRAIKEALPRPQDRLASELEDLLEEHSCLEGIIIDIAQRECAAVQNLHISSIAPYSTALKRLEQTFGLNKDCLALCEFVFINQNFSVVEGYFEDRLEVHNYGSRRMLAYMLDMKPTRLQSCLSELFKCGLFDTGYGNQFRLKDCLLPFWETDSPNMNALFSRPFSGEALPLGFFHVAQSDVAHVRKLLESDSKTPVHILFYGPPGTGKTSFTHSLA